MKDPSRPGNLDGVPGAPDDAARARAFRGREETYRRSKLPEVRQAQYFLWSIENALSQPETEARMRYLIAQAVAGELRDQVRPIINDEVGKLIRENSIMIDMRQLPCGFKIVSFSSFREDWEDILTEFLLEKLIPCLDLRFSKKRTKE